MQYKVMFEVGVHTEEKDFATLKEARKFERELWREGHPNEVFRKLSSIVTHQVFYDDNSVT